MTDVIAALSAPLSPESVSWRVGSTTQDKSKGMALAYIDARDVMKRLDEVCGPANWQRRYPWSDGKRLYCEIGVKLDGEWVWKGDGAGDSDMEAEKGAFSDAFKRAAVSWGIGRYLYDLDSPWVKIAPAGKSFKIADEEYSRLRSILAKGAPQAPRQPVQPANDAPTPRGTDAASDVLRRATEGANALADDLDKAKTDKALAAIKSTNATKIEWLRKYGGEPWGIYERAFDRAAGRLNVSMAG